MRSHASLCPAVASYACAHSQAGARCGTWVVRSAQFALGTSAWLHVLSMHTVSWEQVAAAYMAGLPLGLLLWAGLEPAVRQCMQTASGPGLRPYLTRLLSEGHRAGEQAPSMAAMCLLMAGSSSAAGQQLSLGCQLACMSRAAAACVRRAACKSNRIGGQLQLGCKLSESVAWAAGQVHAEQRCLPIP